MGDTAGRLITESHQGQVVGEGRGGISRTEMTPSWPRALLEPPPGAPSRPTGDDLTTRHGEDQPPAANRVRAAVAKLQLAGHRTGWRNATTSRRAGQS